MNDKILESYLSDFCGDYNVKGDESDNYEHFVNYSIFTKYVPSRFDLSWVHVGENSNYGIDGMGILLNDNLVTDTSHAETIFESCRNVNVDFVFIQTKTSSSFDSGDFLKLCSAVSDFFHNSASLATNSKVSAYSSIAKLIFKNSIKINASPKCHIFFAYTGTHLSANTDGIIQQQKSIINSDKRFSDIIFTIADAGYTREAYRETKNRIERTLQSAYITPLPKIPGIRESFIGVVDGKSFLDFISDSSHTIMRSLFSDNVRDFQGENPVNKDIGSTLRDDALRPLFPVLNNGVTIVAKHASRVSTEITLQNFQIVNGCQTSHMIYRSNIQNPESIFIPIKVIVTDESDVINQITKATNWQTIVTKEAFESLSPFHKTLEEFFFAMNKQNSHHIYYERRSKQYNDTQIKSSQVISMPILIKAYMSMFMALPHAAHQYYGSMLIEHRKNLFQEIHKPLPYYIAALSFNRIENELWSKKYNRFFKEAKHNFLHALGVLFFGDKVPPQNSKDMENGCKKILKTLNNEELFSECISTISRELQQSNPQSDSGYYCANSKAYTAKVHERILSARKKLMQ